MLGWKKKTGKRKKIDMNYWELVQWQIKDESCGCIYPWFTHPMLEVLKSWSLSTKVVLEWGAGRSTAWWAYHAKYVVSIEANEEYAGNVLEELGINRLTHKAYVIEVPGVNEGTQIPKEQDAYVNAPDSAELFYDIIVVDGILRHECMQKALELLSRHGGILISDNWQQDGFVCPASEELMAPYEIHAYVQPDHVDHHGRPWCTAYWEIPKS